GLNIQANNGNPGEVPDINIRGFNSINGGSPLVLVDGIQGNIDRINPLDVESISVLKDAASSAIYGARGAFGVILITTKKGKDGKVQVEYSNNFSSTTPTTRTDYISDPYEYGRTVDAALNGYNGTNYTGFTSEDDWEKLRKVAAGELAPFKELQANGTYKFFDNTDWYGYLFRKWQPGQNHNISVSGGNDKIQGYVSGRAYKGATIQNIADADLVKYNVRGRINLKTNNWLEISDNIQISTDKQTEFGGYKNGYGGPWSTTSWYFLFPFQPNKIDGIPYDNMGTGAQGALEDGYNYVRTYSEQVVNILSAKVTPLKDLVVNVDYSNTINHIANSTRLNPFNYLTTAKATPAVGGLNRLTETRNRNYYNALNIYGTYSKSFFNDKHHTKLLLGYNQEDANSDNI
ncbi:MAG: SusC/RagA family TonB-linked outer membrane protein, partial [Pedobacter sp.]